MVKRKRYLGHLYKVAFYIVFFPFVDGIKNNWKQKNNTLRRELNGLGGYRNEVRRCKKVF